jgi:hypothetical protein
MMGAIDMNTDEIETMLAPEGKLNLADAQEHADTISVMLMVPFLTCFRPEQINERPMSIAIRRPTLMRLQTSGRISPIFISERARLRKLRWRPLVPKARKISGLASTICEPHAIPATRPTKRPIDQQIYGATNLTLPSQSEALEGWMTRNPD